MKLARCCHDKLREEEKNHDLSEKKSTDFKKPTVNVLHYHNLFKITTRKSGKPKIKQLVTQI